MLLQKLNPDRSTQRKMAQASCLLFALLLFFPAHLSAQAQQVILPAREVSVRIALGEIEKQTYYTVAVNWEDINAGNKVLFPANKLTVKEILDKALAGSGCRWELLGKQVAIVRDNAPTEDYPVYSAMWIYRLN